MGGGKKQIQQETSRKMVDIIPTISVVTLNVNGPNTFNCQSGFKKTNKSSFSSFGLTPFLF